RLMAIRLGNIGWMFCLCLIAFLQFCASPARGDSIPEKSRCAYYDYLHGVYVPRALSISMAQMEEGVNYCATYISSGWPPCAWIEPRAISDGSEVRYSFYYSEPITFWIAYGWGYAPYGYVVSKFCTDTPSTRRAGPPLCQNATGNPVDSGSGNKYQREVDLNGPAISFVRHYNSMPGS